MDINYLLTREQVSLMRAASTRNPEARHAHQGLARGYRTLLAARGFPLSVKKPAPLEPNENPNRGRPNA
jgi:hypothetical protein